MPKAFPGKAERALPLLFLLIMAALMAVWPGSSHSATGGARLRLEVGADMGSPSRSAAALFRSSAFERLSFPPPPVPERVIGVPILMYHHVGEAPSDADRLRRNLTVSVADFDAQMSYLQQAGYSPVTGAQLFKALFYNKPLPPKPILLTFDDGYLDNYTVAAPILKKYGFTGTFYIVSEKVGSGDYMSWEQVAELARLGMDIGSHSASHPDLTTLSTADLSRELKESAAAIRSRLGHPIYWFCYPAGRYNDGVKAAASEAGYLLAVTTDWGNAQSSTDPLGLKRFRIRSDTGLEGFKQLLP